MSMPVSGSANQPNYDAVIAKAEKVVMNLGEKQVSVKKGIRAFSNISSVFKLSAKNESKAPASSTHTSQELKELLDQSKAARLTIIKEIQKYGNFPTDEGTSLAKELTTKLSQLNGYIATLENHLSNAASETAPLTESHKIDRSPKSDGKMKITDRIKQAVSGLKGVPGEQSIADKVKTRAEAIKTALTPKKADEATQKSYEKKSESFSNALQNAYKLRDTVAGGESTELAKAIQAAEKYESSQLRSPIKPDTATPKTLTKASEQLTSLTDALKQEMQSIQILKSQHKDAVSNFAATFKQATAARSRNQESPNLANALKMAEGVLHAANADTEKMGLKDLKTGIDTLNQQREELTRAMIVAKGSKGIFTQNAERTIDMVLARLVRQNPNQKMSTPAMKQDLLKLADRSGVSSQTQQQFLTDLSQVGNAEGLKSFLNKYNVNI